MVCGCRLAPTERSLCSVCMLHLPRTVYQFMPDDNPMAQLFWGLAPIERAAALFDYEPHSEVAQLIYKLKYADRPDIGEDMGRLMGNEMQMAGFFDGIDLLIPVPLSRKRMRQRGYNQSERLAEGIRQITGIKVGSHVLKRRHFRKSQTSLNRQERQQNVADMFLLTRPESVRGRHLLLIDDICTTGATLMACVEALNNAENVKISVLTLGMTKK